MAACGDAQWNLTYLTTTYLDGCHRHMLEGAQIDVPEMISRKWFLEENHTGVTLALFVPERLAHIDRDKWHLLMQGTYLRQHKIISCGGLVVRCPELPPQQQQQTTWVVGVKVGAT